MQKNRKQQEQKWINGIRLFGSKKDADQLVRSYYDEIYIFVFRQINDAEKALDLTQDISEIKNSNLLSCFKNGWIYSHMVGAFNKKG